MFTNVTMTLDEKRNVYSFRGNFGVGFKAYIENYVLGKKKSNLLFRSISFMEISIDSFFLLELSMIVGMILDGKTAYSSWVNHKTLKNLNDLLLRDTWLNPDDYNNHGKFKLNMDILDKEMSVKPLDFQKDLYTKYELIKNVLGYIGMLVDAATGTGKAQPLDALIRIPNGWKKMGDIKVDDKVIAANGLITRVTAVYPQGMKDINRITFEDGRSTECCNEHLWKVYYNGDMHIEDTEDISKLLEHGITCHIDLVASELNSDKHYLVSPRDYGSTCEFIPEEYLNGSKRQREELFCGIIGLEDLDYLFTTSYETTSEQLAKDLTLLSRSLGYIVYVNNDNGLYSLKIDLLSTFLEIKSIEAIGQKEAQCISICDEDSLYVTNDYIVTHNTYLGLSLSKALEADFVIMITMKANIDTVWLKTLIDDSDPSKYFFNRKIERSEIFTAADAYAGKQYNGQRYVLFNYEALDKLGQILPFIRNKKATIIVDEAHNFTSLNSARKNNLVGFCKSSNSEDIILLSGTPIKSSTLELIPYLELIDPKFNSVVAAKFKKLYSSPNYILKMCIPIRYGNMSVKIEKEVLNLDPIEYRTMVVKLQDGDKYTLRNIKEDMKKYIDFRSKEINDNLPFFKDSYTFHLAKAKANTSIPMSAWIDYERNFKLLGEYYEKRQLMFHLDLIKAVNDFEKQIILPALKGEEKDKFKEASVILKYPMLKIRGEVLGNVVLGARIACHKEMAKVINYDILDSTTAKTIIMSGYIDVCEVAFQKTKQQGYSPVAIYGEHTKNQTSSIMSFINDEKTNPAIGTYKSISTGHHLVVANLIILLDLPFRTYTLDQALARVYRMGQEKQVIAIYTKLDTGEEYNINSRNIDILKWAKDAVEEITGNTIKGLDFEKGKDIITEISDGLEASGLQNDIVGNWYFSQSVSMLLSDFHDWLAGLESDGELDENNEIYNLSKIVLDPKANTKNILNW